MKKLNLFLTISALALVTSVTNAQQITGSSLFSPTAGGARILSAQGNSAANPAIGFQGTVSTTATAQNDGGGGNGIFRPIANTMAFATTSTERMRITSGGNIGIGTTNPLAKLHIMGNANTSFMFDASSSTSGYTATFRLNDTGLSIGHNSTVRNLTFVNSLGVNMTIEQGGRVGVGTQNFPTLIGASDISAYRLFVKGGILTDELRVATGWADYVFEDNYNLKPLSEVESFIETNGHLPNVPSAKQVELEGISVGEMAKIQQEKIEELTLYIIELNKKLEILEAKLDAK